MNEIVPVPRVSIEIHPATIADLPFIDSLQKLHSDKVGWMPTKALVGKINAGHVIIAKENLSADYADLRRLSLNLRESAQSADHISSPVGYCIGTDQYFKRDDVGIIYQMNIVPDHQRSLIGAALVQAMFDRAAYGCRLFCCWCAQDIAANHFWESLGFLPLAFRAGSRDKGRVHIFWQRRIREGDSTTPYWFPSQTTSGSIREDRLVFPIPPGTHWSDAKPIILPREAEKLPAPKEKSPKNAPRQALRGLWFAPPKPIVQKPQRPAKLKIKNDPHLIAAARELRDRWLEKVNEDPSLLLPLGKYRIAKALAAPVDRKAAARMLAA